MGDVASTAAAAGIADFPPGAEGVTPPTSRGGTGGFLSDVIVKLGFADRETVERAVEAAREPGRSLNQILLERSALTEEELSRAIAQRYGLDHVDLARFEVDMRAAGLISRSSAVRYRAVPIAFATDGALIVAVADPVDALAISDIEVMTKSETRSVVASGAGIDALAKRLPEVGARPPGTPDSVETEEEPEAEPATAEAAASTVEPEFELEAGGERTEVYAEDAQVDRVVESHARYQSDRGGPDPEVRSDALEAKLAAADDALRELAEAYDTLREQSGETEAERAGLREQLMEATRERDRLREALEQVTRQRDRLSEEAQQRSAELASLQERARRAESLAEQATRRMGELEDADHRAETARLALRELREESEREREQSRRLERKLREELTVAEECSAALEQHLSDFMDSAAEAKATAEKLMAAHGSIADGDTESESDRAPPTTPGQPQATAPARSGGPPGQGDHPSTDVQKPNI